MAHSSNDIKINPEIVNKIAEMRQAKSNLGEMYGTIRRLYGLGLLEFKVHLDATYSKEELKEKYERFIPRLMKFIEDAEADESLKD